MRESDDTIKRKKNKRKKKYFTVEAGSEMIDVANSARNQLVSKKFKDQPMGIVDEKGSNQEMSQHGDAVDVILHDEENFDEFAQ